MGCSGQKTSVQNLDISSLYSVESNSFDLNGYQSGTDWRDVCKTLNINVDELNTELGYYIGKNIEIYPNAEGFISAGEVTLDNITASTTYKFYHEKLYSIIYNFNLGTKNNDERKVIATQLETDLNNEFTNFATSNDNELGGFDSAYKSWFIGSEGNMSSITIESHTDSDSGKLSVSISITSDISSYDSVTSQYIDQVSPTIRITTIEFSANMGSRFICTTKAHV